MLALWICREMHKVKSPAKLNWPRPALITSLSQSGNGMDELASSFLRFSAIKYRPGENRNLPLVGNDYICWILKKTQSNVLKYSNSCNESMKVYWTGYKIFLHWKHKIGRFSISTLGKQKIKQQQQQNPPQKKTTKKPTNQLTKKTNTKLSWKNWNLCYTANISESAIYSKRLFYDKRKLKRNPSIIAKHMPSVTILDAR